MIRNPCRGAAFVALVAASGASSAQSCNVPSPFDYIKGYSATAVWEGAAATSCTLRVRLGTGDLTPVNPRRTGFTTATLSSPLPHTRLRFHVDASALTGINSIRPAGLATLVSSATPPLTGVNQLTAILARVSLTGNIAGTQRTLVLLGGDAANPQGYSTNFVDGVPAAFDVGVEVTVGAPGSVKLWLDSDFDVAPTMSMPVQNTAWVGVSGIAIGVLDPFPSFIVAYAGQDVLFSDIALQETLFVDSFE